MPKEPQLQNLTTSLYSFEQQDYSFSFQFYSSIAQLELRMDDILPLVQQFFPLKFVISSAFALVSFINEATFSFSSSFSQTYHINSLHSTDILLPTLVSQMME